MSIATPFSPLGYGLREWVYTPLTSNTSNPELEPVPALTTPGDAAHPANPELLYRAFSGSQNVQIGGNNNGVFLEDTDRGRLRCSLLTVRFPRARRFRAVVVGNTTDAQHRAVYCYDGGVLRRKGPWVYQYRSSGPRILFMPCDFEGTLLTIASYHDTGSINRPDYTAVRFFE